MIDVIAVAQLLGLLVKDELPAVKKLVVRSVLAGFTEADAGIADALALDLINLSRNRVSAERGSVDLAAPCPSSVARDGRGAAFNSNRRPRHD